MASAKDISGSSEEPTAEADPPNNSNVKVDANEPTTDAAQESAKEATKGTKGEKDQGSVEAVAGGEEDLLSSDCISVIYFTVGDNHEAALVPFNAPPDDIKGENSD